jgi:hypothetical protein
MSPPDPDHQVVSIYRSAVPHRFHERGGTCPDRHRRSIFAQAFMACTLELDARLVAARAPRLGCPLHHRSRVVPSSRTSRGTPAPRKAASLHLGVVEPTPAGNCLPVGGGINVAIFTGADPGNDCCRPFHICCPHQFDSWANRQCALRANDSLQSGLTFTACAARALARTNVPLAAGPAGKMPRGRPPRSWMWDSGSAIKGDEEFVQLSRSSGLIQMKARLDEVFICS